MSTEISREQIEEIFPKVAEIIADALGCDEDEVNLDSFLISDLGAESIDFLDIVFRLEREFKVKIPQGKIVETARGDLSEGEFEEDGVVTEAGVAKIKEFMTEVPEDRFPETFRTAEIPKLFTVETFCKTVLRDNE